MIPVQSQSGLHDFSLIETPGSDTDISCYEESESPLGEEKGKRSEYEGNGDGNYLLGIKKHRRREREKNCSPAISLSVSTNRRTERSRVVKRRRRRWRKRRRCTFSAIISAHLSRVFLLRLSPRHKPRSLSRVRSLDS